MRIANWERFQGYRKRGPEWIKLHLCLLDKPEYLRLPLVSRAILPALWITAARTSEDGELPDDAELIAVLTHLPLSEITEGLQPLIASGFVVCDKPVALPAITLSGEREKSKSRDRAEQRQLAPPAASRETWLTPYFDAWREVYPDADLEQKAGMMAKILRPLDKKHGAQRVAAELVCWLRQCDPHYGFDLTKFAAAFGTWQHGKGRKPSVTDQNRAELESFVRGE